MTGKSIEPESPSKSARNKMYSLCRASRRALISAVGMQETVGESLRAYNTKTACRATCRKSKEERCELVMQFVAKFKDSHNGRLPGISLVRREVGGSYETLKEILGGLEKCQNEVGTSAQTIELKEVDSGTQDFGGVRKFGCKKQRASVEKDSNKDQRAMPKISRSKENVDLAESRVVTVDIEEKQRKGLSRNGSHSAKDVSDGAGEDGAVITSEQGDGRLPEESGIEDPDPLPVDWVNLLPMPPKRAEVDTAFQDPVVDSQQRPHKKSEPHSGFTLMLQRTPMYATSADLREAFKDCGEILNAGVLFTQKIIPSLIKKSSLTTAIVNFKTEDGLKAALNKERVRVKGHVVYVKNDTTRMQAPPKTVVRILNLPAEVSTQQLRSICEKVASVNGIEFRRGHIADVQFNVKTSIEMNDIILRLRNISIGTTKLKAFLAQRYFVGSNADHQLVNLQDKNNLQQARDFLIMQIEQRFKNLRVQFQDYQELIAMKRIM